MSLSSTLPFSQKSLTLNNSEGEQSPPGNITTSAHEYSVFANVNLQGNSSTSINYNHQQHQYLQQHHQNFSQSNITLNTLVSDITDTISLSSTMNCAPELPKRSNSIISMTTTTNTLSNNNNNSSNNNSLEQIILKPVLSPRFSDNFINLNKQQQSTGGSSTTINSITNISPKILDSLNEELCTAGGGHQEILDFTVPSSNLNKMNNYNIG